MRITYRWQDGTDIDHVLDNLFRTEHPNVFVNFNADLRIFTIINPVNNQIRREGGGIPWRSMTSIIRDMGAGSMAGGIEITVEGAPPELMITPMTCECCGRRFPHVSVRRVLNQDLCPHCFEENVAVCEGCGAYRPRHEVTNSCYSCHVVTDPNPRCRSCQPTRCDRCGGYVDDDERSHAVDTPGGGVLCQHCAGVLRTCDECGHILWGTNSFSIEGERHLCQLCFEEGGYVVCLRCNEAFDRDDMVEYDGRGLVCHSCYDHLVYSPHRFDYRPVPIFHKMPDDHRDEPYLGFEAEIILPEEMSKREAIKLVFDHSAEGSEQRYYVKHDGSVGYGFEVVTHPATLRWHMHKAPWQGVFDSLLDSSAIGDTTSCGFHVHITKPASVSHQIRIGMFVHGHPRHMRTLARRSNKRWAKFKDIKGDIAHEARYSAERYEAINWQNNATVEFRIFKGTLDYELAMANLQAVHAIYSFTKVTPSPLIADGRKGWAAFVRFVNERKGYRDLVERFPALFSPIQSQ